MGFTVASLFRDPVFRRLWIGQTASQLGEHTSLVVLPLIAVLTLHASSAEVGVLRAVGQAPFLVLALFAGVWVDRLGTRTVMVSADLLRAAVLCATAAIGFGLPGLAVAAFLVGSMSVLFDIAYQTSGVRLLARDELVRANSALEGIRSVARMGGLALGGLVVSLLPAPMAIVVGAVFFAVSFAAIGSIRASEPRADRRTRIREGIGFVVRTPELRAIAVASAVFQFTDSALLTALLIFLPRDLGLSAGAIGLVLAATGPGAVAGALMAVRLPARFGYGRTMIVSAVVSNATTLLIPALHGPPVVTVTALLAINLVTGALGQLVYLIDLAVRQRVTPAPLLGRVAATISFAGMGMTPLGALAGGLLAGAAGARTALLCAAVAMPLSTLALALSPLPRIGRTL